jgi:hypothetical protein
MRVFDANTGVGAALFLRVETEMLRYRKIVV